MDGHGRRPATSWTNAGEFIRKIGATDYNAKMHQIWFPTGLRPRARWGSLRRSPDLLAVFKGATHKRKEGEGGRERKGKEG